MAYFKLHEHTIWIWDLTQYTPILKVPRYLYRGRPVLSPDGCVIVTHYGHYFRYARLAWELKVSLDLPEAIVIEKKRQYFGHKPVNHMKVNAGNDLLFFVSDGGLCVWDITRNTIVECLYADGNNQNSVYPDNEQGYTNLIIHPTDPNVLCVSWNLFANYDYWLPLWSKVFRYKRDVGQLVCTERFEHAHVDWSPDGLYSVVVNGTKIQIRTESSLFRTINLMDLGLDLDLRCGQDRFDVEWCRFNTCTSLLLKAQIGRRDEEYALQAGYTLNLRNDVLTQHCMVDVYDDLDEGAPMSPRPSPTEALPFTPRIEEVIDIMKLPIGLIKSILSHTDPVTYYNAMLTCKTFRRVTRTSILFQKRCTSRFQGWGPLISILRSIKKQSWKQLYTERQDFLCKNMVMDSYPRILVNPYQGLDNSVTFTNEEH